MLSEDKLTAAVVIGGGRYTLSELTLEDQQRLEACNLTRLEVGPQPGDPFQLRVWLDEGLLPEVLSVVLRDEQGQRPTITRAQCAALTHSQLAELVHDFFFLNPVLTGFLLSLRNAIPSSSGAGPGSAGGGANSGSTWPAVPPVVM